MACPSSSHSRWENWDLNPDRFHCLYHDTKIQKLQTRGLSQIWLTDIFCLAHIVFKKKQTWICCQCFKIENLHIKKQNLFFPTSLAKNQKTGNAGPVFPPERDWDERPSPHLLLLSSPNQGWASFVRAILRLLFSLCSSYFTCVVLEGLWAHCPTPYGSAPPSFWPQWCLGCGGLVVLLEFSGKLSHWWRSDLGTRRVGKSPTFPFLLRLSHRPPSLI